MFAEALIVTEEIYDVRESHNCPRTFAPYFTTIMSILKVNNIRMEDFVKILDNRSEEDEGTLGRIRGSGSLFQKDMYLNVRNPLCADACQGKIMAALNSRRDYFSVKSQVPASIIFFESVAKTILISFEN